MTDSRPNDAPTESGTLVLDGALTIAEVAMFKQRLLEAFDQAGAVTVDVSAIAAIDVAGAQVLLAGHRFAIRNRRLLQIRVGANQPLRQLAEQAGLVLDLVGEADAGGTCCWRKT